MISNQEKEQLVIDTNNELVENAKNTKPEDTAALYFFQYSSEFSTLVRDLSNKDAKRLLEALVLYPLVDNELKFNSEAAKHAFIVGANLIDAKHVMRAAIEMERLGQAELSETQGEVSNG